MPKIGPYSLFIQDDLTDPDITSDTASDTQHEYVLLDATYDEDTTPDFPFHSQYQGEIELDVNKTQVYTIAMLFEHVFDDGSTFSSDPRKVIQRIGQGAIAPWAMNDFSSISVVPSGQFDPSLFSRPVRLIIKLQVSAAAAFKIESLSVTQAKATFWQLTYDEPEPEPEPAPEPSPALFLFSGEDALADWLNVAERSPRLSAALAAAREIVTARVSAPRVGNYQLANRALPESLDLATTMIAAQFYDRRKSIFGVDSFSVEGEAGFGFLTTDPTIQMLLAPWLAPRFGAAPTTPQDAGLSNIVV